MGYGLVDAVSVRKKDERGDRICICSGLHAPCAGGLQKAGEKFCRMGIYTYLCKGFSDRHTGAYDIAEIAQLVEHNLAKVGVASSSLVFRSLLEWWNR